MSEYDNEYDEDYDEDESEYLLNSVEEVVSGLGQGVLVSDIKTKSLAVIDSFDDNGKRIKMVQTNTNIMMEYNVGHHADLYLIGTMLLNNEQCDNDFSNLDALIEAMQGSELTFDLYGSCLGVGIIEATWVGSKGFGSHGDAADAIDNLEEEDTIGFRKALHHEYANAINNKTLTEFADIAEKSKLAAIDFLKTKHMPESA